MHQTIIKFLRLLVALIFVSTLTACGAFFDKDNTPQPTPLTKFTPVLKPHLLWSTKTGSGSEYQPLKLQPTMDGAAIYTASNHGVITSVDKSTGRINWQTRTGADILTGPAASEGLVVVGTRRGEVIALSESNGNMLWKVVIPGEILSKPAIQNGTVVVKAVDGYLRALSAQDGHEKWSYQQVEPTLILRGASSPLIYHRNILAGFANGNLSKFTLGGELLWTQAIATPEGAFSIERMIDIDADPIVYQGHIYAATYQGQIASLDGESGKILWSHDISSYTGMVADNNNIYITDASSYVWAFDAQNGEKNWRQLRLQARVISPPALMGNYIVVGDGQGYVHWLNKNDGQFAARTYAKSAVYAAPLVDNNILYVFTSAGYLRAYLVSA